MLGIERMGERKPLSDYGSGPNQSRFSPYTDNAGTVIGLAGKDYAIIASDTRLMAGGGSGSILTRNQSKIFQLNSKTALGCTGCWCDSLTLSRVIEARMKIYKNTHQEDMSCNAIARMLCTMLYHKRFFPYYVFNILAGLDENGEGFIYGYDPVGSYEKMKYGSAGSANPLVQPLLDSQFGKKNLANLKDSPAKAMSDITLDEAVALIHDCFVSATERQVETGDGVAMKIITKAGVEERFYKLRTD